MIKRLPPSPEILTLIVKLLCCVVGHCSFPIPSTYLVDRWRVREAQEALRAPHDQDVSLSQLKAAESLVELRS